MTNRHSLPEGWWPEKAIRNNGPDALALERYKLRELAEGWPVYRDACEWENFKSIFWDDAYIYTTWSGRMHHIDFIDVSKAGIKVGTSIMHRSGGITTDINIEATRAVTKMKATITQRFVIDGCEVDAESDCRFCYFWEKCDGRWGARFVRHWYEKDKLIPVDPRKVPTLDDEKLKKLPYGYRYLGYCQEETMGVKVVPDMPGRIRDADNANGKMHDMLYSLCKKWIEGEKLDI